MTDYIEKQQDYTFEEDEAATINNYLKDNTIRCTECDTTQWDMLKDKNMMTHSIDFAFRCSKCQNGLHRNVLTAIVTSIEDEQRTDYEESFKTDDGKVKAGILQDFSRALMEVAKVGTMGIDFKGYKRGSWLDLPDAEERYLDAFWRHLLDTRDINTEDNDVIILAQIVWNGLARLELKLRREND